MGPKYLCSCNLSLQKKTGCCFALNCQGKSYYVGYWYALEGLPTLCLGTLWSIVWSHESLKIPQLVGRRSHVDIGNDMMIVLSHALIMSRPRYQSRHEMLSFKRWWMTVKQHFSHDVACWTHCVDMDWLFEEDCSRGPGILDRRSLEGATCRYSVR